MLTSVLVRLAGGVWGLKGKCTTARTRWGRSLARIFYERHLARFGCWIGHTAQFASPPVLPHGFHGIFITGSARVGRNCVIFHQVTIGSNTLIDSKGRGAPVIGDDCYLGAGAKVIGAVRVGNNVRIGANCVVTQDVPDNSVVVAGAPRVISKERLNNRYYSKKGGEWVYSNGSGWIKETSPEAIAALERTSVPEA